MEKNIKHLRFLLVVLFCNICFANSTPPPPPNPPPVTPGFPIDSSLYVLMVVGIVYVIIDFRRRQKNSKSEL